MEEVVTGTALQTHHIGVGLETRQTIHGGSGYWYRSPDPPYWSRSGDETNHTWRKWLLVPLSQKVIILRVKGHDCTNDVISCHHYVIAMHLYGTRSGVPSITLFVPGRYIHTYVIALISQQKSYVRSYIRY